MNCNPFTNGHRYLIEEAAGQVDALLVFVVQEDGSEFSFKDRIDLVRKGTADLENVFVFASGRYMISSQTFPGYFNKKELQDVIVDSSKDVYTFVRFIAPALNIKKRFVGEEPFDKVTDSYNQQMKIILPEYGVELVEIKRKQCDGNAISASHVRELLENRNFGEIQKLVPESTLRYLMDRG